MQHLAKMSLDAFVMLLIATTAYGMGTANGLAWAASVLGNHESKPLPWYVGWLLLAFIIAFAWFFSK